MAYKILKTNPRRNTHEFFVDTENDLQKLPKEPASTALVATTGDLYICTNEKQWVKFCDNEDEEEESSNIEVISLNATENNVYTAPEGKAYSPVTVNVESDGVTFGNLHNISVECFDGAWTYCYNVHSIWFYESWTSGKADPPAVSYPDRQGRLLHAYSQDGIAQTSACAGMGVYIAIDSYAADGNNVVQAVKAGSGGLSPENFDNLTDIDFEFEVQQYGTFASFEMPELEGEYDTVYILLGSVSTSPTPL